MRLLAVLLVAGWVSTAWAQATDPQPTEAQPTEEKQATPQEDKEKAAETERKLEDLPSDAVVSKQEAEGIIAEHGDEAWDFWTASCLTGDWGGVRTDLEEKGIKFSFFLTTGVVWNARGGNNTHNAHSFDGKMFYNIILDFEKMGLWEGGEFFFRGIQTWGNGIQGDTGSRWPAYISWSSSGDRAIEIDKYWWRQRLFDDKLEFRLGMLHPMDLVDRNKFADSYVTEFNSGVLFHNPTIPFKKGLGAFLKVWPADWTYASFTFTDAETVSSHNRHGTGGWDTAFNDECHYMFYNEIGILPHFLIDGMPEGTYRLGLWYDPRTKNEFRNSWGGLRTTKETHADTGIFLSFDQDVWKENDDPKDKQGIGIFGRYGYADQASNKIQNFYSLGVNWLGAIPERDKDVIGFGVAVSDYSKDYRREVYRQATYEAVYELYYAIHVAPCFVITPDIQYIANPDGRSDVRDAITAGVRFKIVF